MTTRTTRAWSRWTCQKRGDRRQIRSVSTIPSPESEDGSPLPARPCGIAGPATRALLEAAVDSGYTGDAWEELARRLVTRALPDLEGAIRSGAIVGRCRRFGLAISPQPGLQRRPWSEDIAAEAVEQCLARFKAKVLPAGEWDPERGNSLEDFFTSCCLPDVANRWRWHLRRLLPDAIELDGLEEPGQASVLAQALNPPLDPAYLVELRDELTRVTALMSPDDKKTFMLIDQGWSPAEIATFLGISRNTLDARISRARKAARARRTP